jgi:T-complex protein 1 subunit zeta
MSDACVVPGAGSFEISAYRMLMRRKGAVSGRAKLGVEAFANAMLVIPKTLAENSGLDVQESIIKVEEEQERTDLAVGLDLNSGDTLLPAALGIWDSYTVKKQTLNLSTVLANQLLLVDEVGLVFCSLSLHQLLSVCFFLTLPLPNIHPLMQKGHEGRKGHGQAGCPP